MSTVVATTIMPSASSMTDLRIISDDEHDDDIQQEQEEIWYLQSTFRRSKDGFHSSWMSSISEMDDLIELSSFDSDYECESDDCDSVSTKATGCSSSCYSTIPCYVVDPDHKPTKSVQFGTVSIREYSVTVGAAFPDEDYEKNDPNIVCCPIALDWEYNPTEHVMNVFEYEYYRGPTLCGNVGHLRLSPNERRRRIASVRGISIEQVYTMESQRRAIARINYPRPGGKSLCSKRPVVSCSLSATMTPSKPLMVHSTTGPMAPRLLDGFMTASSSSYSLSKTNNQMDYDFVTRLQKLDTIRPVSSKSIPTTKISRAA